MLDNQRPFYILFAAFFLLQTPLLFSPPNHSHTWRQCDTAAIARNFLEENNNIFLPRIDQRGSTDGVTGMEFPLYSYTVYIFYEIFGFDHRLGKAASLLFALLGLFFMWKLAHRLGGMVYANVVAFSLALSNIYFGYATKVLPEMMALCLHIMALSLFAKEFSLAEYNPTPPPHTVTDTMGLSSVSRRDIWRLHSYEALSRDWFFVYRLFSLPKIWSQIIIDP